MKTIKKNWESKQKVNIKTYLKKKKTKRESMEKTDVIICLRMSEEKEQKVKEYQKNYREAKEFLIVNKIVS